jgi:UDP-glucuronate decarboxylase
MSKTHILVTGGAGNVGSGLARRLVEDKSLFVVIVDDLSTGQRWKLPHRSHENWCFIKADVNTLEDLAPVLTSYRFDTIFHYAAVVGVHRTLQNPISVLKDIEGLKNLLSLAKNTGVRRVYFSSSSEVYGEPVEVPQCEDTTPLNSRLPYAIVKNVGEAFLRSYHQEHGLEYGIFRFFNTYGPRQSEDFVITRFLKQARLNQPITIYGDGSQTRTFCYIDDNVAATVKAFYENQFVNDTVNIGSDEEITILDLALKVKKITGSSSQIIHLPPLKEGDMSRRCPSIDKMKRLLENELTPLDVGIAKTLAAPQFEEMQDAATEQPQTLLRPSEERAFLLGSTR